MKKKTVILLASVVLALLIAFATFALWPGNITRQEASAIALSHIGGGHANRPEFDFERFQRVWSVEIFYNGLVYEVYVHRFTGQIVAVEIDGWW